MAVEYVCLYCRCGAMLLGMVLPGEVDAWRQQHSGRGHGECSRQRWLALEARRAREVHQRAAGQSAEEAE